MKSLAKTLLLSTALSLSALSSASAEAGGDQHVCGAMGALAGSIMEMRQTGVPLSEMMRRITDAVADEAMKEFARAAVMMAYAAPYYSTREFKENAINEFRNEAELSCFKSM